MTVTKVFVDTSALYALLDRDDANHGEARVIWARLSNSMLLTHNYVLVETTALVQRRIGLEVVRTLHDVFVPLLSVVWVDLTTHSLALEAVTASGERAVSLVDRVSFHVVRTMQCTAVFAFDEDFTRQGIDVLKA